MCNIIQQGCALAMDADTVRMLWQTPILGMGMIFAVLGLLWAVLAVFKLVFAKQPKPTKETVKEAPPAPKAAVPAAPAPAATDDAALIAVLTAAVAAYRDAEAGEGEIPCGFRVVSFRRARGGRSWNANS